MQPTVMKLDWVGVICNFEQSVHLIAAFHWLKDKRAANRRPGCDNKQKTLGFWITSLFFLFVSTLPLYNNMRFYIIYYIYNTENSKSFYTTSCIHTFINTWFTRNNLEVNLKRANFLLIDDLLMKQVYIEKQQQHNSVSIRNIWGWNWIALCAKDNVLIH